MLKQQTQIPVDSTAIRHHLSAIQPTATSKSQDLSTPTSFSQYFQQSSNKKIDDFSINQLGFDSDRSIGRAGRADARSRGPGDPGTDADPVRVIIKIYYVMTWVTVTQWAAAAESGEKAKRLATGHFHTNRKGGRKNIPEKSKTSKVESEQDEKCPTRGGGKGRRI